MTTIKTIGFMGLGLMGGSFAANLLKGGLAVVGYDPSPAAGEAIEALGGTMQATPHAAAKAAELIIVMVPDTPQIDEILSGQDG